MADEDPFAVFGDDDDDDDNVESPPSSSRAQTLMHSANQRMLHNRTVHEDGTSVVTQSIAVSDERKSDSNALNIVHLSWDPPLYIGPIACVSSLEYGGGREFVAARNLEPGTLILVEEPALEWSQDQIGSELGLTSVYHILEQDDAQKLLHDLEDFHPTKVAVDEFKAGDVQIIGMVENLEVKYVEALPTLVDLAKVKKLVNRDGSTLTVRDIVRLLLALRYNGFESGVYLHLAMLNHNCYPNSVKFFPTNSFSEVRTTRHVKAGEALTISYLPTIMSHASRRHHLWEQHFFDIGGVVPDEYKDIERVGGRIPHSSPESRDESAITSRIESTIGAFDDHFREMSTLALENSRKENPVWEEAKALELASLELYREAKEQLQNDRHLLLIPCLRLHLDLCEKIHVSRILTPSQHVLLLLRTLSSCINLIEIQKLAYGLDHFDLARSYNELSQTLTELLSVAPKKLVALGLNGLDSVPACSAAEHTARKEFHRIRDLYPKDAQQYIQQPIQ
ncbi:SET domain-containing protein [Fragilaria crotonensis]|nr:SET domain-containing protein [Fragilaria crotonensis]